MHDQAGIAASPRAIRLQTAVANLAELVQALRELAFRHSARRFGRSVLGYTTFSGSAER